MRCALILFLWVAPAMAAGSLQATLDTARADAREFLEIDTRYDIPSQRAAKAISAAALASADAPRFVEKVAKSIGVTTDVASALAEIHLRGTLAYGEIRDPDEQKRVDELLRFALRKAATNADVMAFCIAHDRRAGDALLAEYLPLLRSFPSTGIATISGALNVEVRAIVIADALGRAPDDPLLQQALTSGYDPALQAAFGPVRISGGRRVLRESWQRLETATLARHGSQQIAALAGAGRAADAVAAFDALPKRARDVILAGPLTVDGGSLDVRLDVAASATLTGESERALALMAVVRPVRNESDPTEHLFSDACSKHSLRRARRPMCMRFSRTH